MGCQSTISNTTQDLRRIGGMIVFPVNYTKSLNDSTSSTYQIWCSTTNSTTSSTYQAVLMERLMVQTSLLGSFKTTASRAPLHSRVTRKIKFILWLPIIIQALLLSIITKKQDLDFFPRFWLAEWSIEFTVRVYSKLHQAGWYGRMGKVSKILDVHDYK